MINKYTIDLRQFNNGEGEKITFPTFDQCLMYGIYKLKCSLKEGIALLRAILIEDTLGRRIVVSPTEEELGEGASNDEYSVSKVAFIDKSKLNIRMYHDEEDNSSCIYL